MRAHTLDVTYMYSLLFVLVNLHRAVTANRAYSTAAASGIGNELVDDGLGRINASMNAVA